MGKNSVHAPIVKSAAMHFKNILGSTSIVQYEAKLTPKAGCKTAEPRSDIMIRNIITSQCQQVDFIFPTIKENATELNSTVMMAEEYKVGYYQDNYELLGAQMVPGAIDSYGRWGESLKKLVAQVARSGSSNERDYSRVVNRLRSSLAIAHVRSIGKQIAMFLGRHFTTK